MMVSRKVSGQNMTRASAQLPESVTGVDRNIGIKIRVYIDQKLGHDQAVPAWLLIVCL